MASQEHLEKMQLRQNYRNLWHTDLMSTIQADTPCTIAALRSFDRIFFWDCAYFCKMLWVFLPLEEHVDRAPCASYLLRKRALYNDMSRYVCCAGYMPCSGRCGESKCPEFCLATEVFLCFGNSVASTRFLLQDEFNIQTTQCDNCIIGFMFCLQQIACIFSIVAMIVGSEEIQQASQLLSCLADMVYCTVCACMQTQHKVEMDKRDGKFGPQPMAVPPVQQMSRIDQPIPPSVGYPPQTAYGQPYGYPPAPQAQGYPAPSYPPAQYPPPGYPPSGYSR
ncbi:PLAC8 family protein [Parasponia andersonii]|uniref:PLAC8 family protein n=1 Tax=Parasponia andersonii TaxID=3476 RepID=A0A2P5CPG1_PARAD|nr:PLAC8 family protein [Parasponia andersonii]